MWNNINLPGLGIIALKAIVIYAFIILAIRIFGKKELSQLSVVDLVFILLISNSVQNAMVGSDNTVLGGIAAATGLFVVNYILKLVIRRFPSLSNIIQGHALMLIHEGKVIRENLDRSLISMEELKAAVREHGVERLDEVDLAILEVDGNISVMSRDYSKRTVFRKKAHKLIKKR